jgi:hypothetical protein
MGNGQQVNHPTIWLIQALGKAWAEDQQTSTLMSGWQDYVILMTTLFDIIFHWWSQTLNNDQNVFIKHDFLFQVIEFAASNLDVMEWPCPSRVCWVSCLAHPNRGSPGALLNIMAWQGLDHSIVHKPPSSLLKQNLQHLIAPWWICETVKIWVISSVTEKYRKHTHAQNLPTASQLFNALTSLWWPTIQH